MQRTLLRAAAPATLALALAAPTPAQDWTTSNISSARQLLAGTSVGDLAIFAGGVSGTVASNRVDIYDRTTETWSQATLSQARSELAAASTSTHAVFAGGVAGGVSSRRVDIYDAATDTWSNTQMSVQRQAPAAAAVGDLVFIGGGYWTDIVDVYDTSDGTWSAMNLSQMRGDLAAISVGTKVLFAGGWTGAPSNRVDIYDTATGTWSTASLSQARYRLAAARVGSKVLFAGGAVSVGQSSDVVDIYDDATGTWSTDVLSEPRELLSGAHANGCAVFVGGYNAATATNSASVEMFDLVGDAVAFTNLSAARWGMGGASLPDRVVYAGGSGGAGSSTVVDIHFAPLGRPYCGTMVPNSTGVPGELRLIGTDIVSFDEVTFRATELPAHATTIFMCSTTQGQVHQPGNSEGVLCLSGNVGRFYGPGGAWIQSSGSAGVVEHVVDTTMLPHPSGTPVAIQPGDTWSFQAWHRDSNGGTATSNFTRPIYAPFH